MTKTILFACFAVLVFSFVVTGFGRADIPLSGTMKSIDGSEIDLATYEGKVVLVVNVASKCGATPQYEGLQSLYEKYKDQGFTILGFPANDFGRQEPGSDAQIKDFCSTNYSVTFPMFSKVVVKGPEKVQLYKTLTETADPSGEVGWNFEKFLIGKDGQIKGRFMTRVRPEDSDLVEAIETALAK